MAMGSQKFFEGGIFFSYILHFQDGSNFFPNKFQFRGISPDPLKPFPGYAPENTKKL